MILNKAFNIILTSVLTFSVFSLSAVKAKAPEEITTLEAQESTSKATTQEYQTLDGKTNTIYWTQGIHDMPKMTSDKKLQNTEGYFNVSYSSGYYTYEKEYVEGLGYYDLNKNEQRRGGIFDPVYGTVYENSLCYLSSATNLLHWWFDQNEQYIARYVERLNNGTLVQPKELVNISDTSIFTEMGKSPELKLVNGAYRQEIRYSNISWPTFVPYFKSMSGFFSDKVWDFFINGYYPWGNVSDQMADPTVNNEGSYGMDPRGGFFYPIFGKKQLTTRLNTGKYSDINKYIKDHLDKGDAMSLYYFVGAGDASHALTLWGAEYDEEGMLKRVYISDSDDNDSNIPNKDNLRGIYGYDIHVDEDGLAHLGNNGDNAKNNNMVIMGLSSLSLGQDMFNAVLNDTGEVNIPTITTNPLDYQFGSYNSATAKTLEVDAYIRDTGTLSYQWYEASSLTDEGTPISGATSRFYKPSIKGGNQVKYYYCLVTNTKQGQTASIKSRYAKITVDSSLIDASRPVINRQVKPNIEKPNTSKPYTFQYTNPGIMRVEASSTDGGTISYQWYKKGLNEKDPFVIIPGATNNYYIPETTGSTVNYQCLVTNTKEGATGSTTSTIEGYRLRIDIVEVNDFSTAKPYILSQSTDKSYVVGAYAAPLVVEGATGDGGELTYQWYQIDQSGNDILLEGQNNNTLEIDTSNAGIFKYKCVVNNFNAMATKTKDAKTSSEIITINVGNMNPIKVYNPMTSLLINYDTTSLNPNSVKLRFGFRMESTLIDTDKYEYGMIILAADDYKNNNSISSLDKAGLDTLKKSGFAHAIPPVEVISNGTSYSQFAWVINNIPKNKYDFEFSAYVYELNKATGEINISFRRTESVISTKNNYLNKKEELKLDESIIKVLENIK